MRGTSPVALVCLTAALAVFGFPSKLSAQGVSSEMRARELLDKYCVSCHNERLQTGGLALDRANLERAGDNAPVWEKVIVKLHAAQCPRRDFQGRIKRATKR